MNKEFRIAPPVILWFRQDLRTVDQAALAAAAGDGPVVPVFILDDERPGRWRIGSAQRWWLHGSLEALAKDLHQLGSRLTLRQGESVATLIGIAKEIGADRVHCIRHHEPWWTSAEAELSEQLDLRCHEGNTLTPVGSLRSSSGGIFKRFAPFWTALNAAMPPAIPQPAPQRLDAPDRWPASDQLESWLLKPTGPDWAQAFARIWKPGERGAHERLEAFRERAAQYPDRRDFPSDDEGTSWLSPHLHFGELSPAALWHALSPHRAADFLRELAWREFAQHMISAFPTLGDENGNARFDRMQWRVDADADCDFLSWAAGRTGYPIVDAGMRQLWSIGWMHNRVRMITASFLVKHLLIDWRKGEQWFWDTLVDADYANNSLNWQWIAGTGVDASPFFRIMAPLLQSKKFAATDYIRDWLPELEAESGEALHDPEKIGSSRRGYPVQIVGHREARDRALSAWRAMNGAE